MNKRSSRKKNRFFSKYLFLIFGAAVLLLILISWFAFPGWHSQPGGFWVLVGLVIAGALGVMKDLVSIYKDVAQIKKESSPGTKLLSARQVQKVKDSEDVDQSVENVGGMQEQSVENSKHVKQSMK